MQAIAFNLERSLALLTAQHRNGGILGLLAQKLQKISLLPPFG
jgi:hypothetical protein